jgi:hypothetical protein
MLLGFAYHTVAIRTPVVIVAELATICTRLSFNVFSHRGVRFAILPPPAYVCYAPYYVEYFPYTFLYLLLFLKLLVFIILISISSFTGR